MHPFCPRSFHGFINPFCTHEKKMYGTIVWIRHLFIYSSAVLNVKMSISYNWEVACNGRCFIEKATLTSHSSYGSWADACSLHWWSTRCVKTEQVDGWILWSPFHKSRHTSTLCDPCEHDISGCVSNSKPECNSQYVVLWQMMKHNLIIASVFAEPSSYNVGCCRFLFPWLVNYMYQHILYFINCSVQL